MVLDVSDAFWKIPRRPRRVALVLVSASRGVDVRLPAGSSGGSPGALLLWVRVMAFSAQSMCDPDYVRTIVYVV